MQRGTRRRWRAVNERRLGLMSEPFLPIGDSEPPLTDSEPPSLDTEYQPSLRDVSQQIGAVSSHLAILHREQALLRSDFSTLSSYVMGEHAPRIAAVEKHTFRRAGKYGALLLAVPALLQALAQLKPGLAGPVEIIVNLLNGLGQ